MLMVERKQEQLQLAATASPLQTAKRTSASSSRSSEVCYEMDRINLLDLKEHIVKRVGIERANKYFLHFRTFLSSNLSKAELDKLVTKTIGKENVRLHNQLIKAILSNALKAKSPPASQPVQVSSKPPVKSYSPCITSDDTTPSTLSNGDSHRGRSATLRDFDRDHKASSLGHREEEFTPDLSRPVQHLDSAAKPLDAESNSTLEPPAKRARLGHPGSDDSTSAVESGISCGGVSASTKEESVDVLPPFTFGSSLKTHLGIPFSYENVTAGRSKLLLQEFPAQLLRECLQDELYNAAELPDGDVIYARMHQTAAEEGLAGINRESAEVLYTALDAYLLRIIRSCVESRSGSHMESPTGNQTSWSNSVKDVKSSGSKLNQGINGVRTMPMAEFYKKDKEKINHSISLADFKTSMDANRDKLGQDWPLQLEKISLHMFDQEASRN